MPLIIYKAVHEMNTSACPALTSYVKLTSGAANLIIRFGTKEDRALFIPKMLSGDWQGTMCLTEPQCGTDLGQVKTRAESNADGSYAISGGSLDVDGRGMIGQTTGVSGQYTQSGGTVTVGGDFVAAVHAVQQAGGCLLPRSMCLQRGSALLQLERGGSVKRVGHLSLPSAWSAHSAQAASSVPPAAPINARWW